jgi:nucleoside 2-deoxyribosyltransferase
LKIYLAGPDVFRPDVAAWADSARELCRRYGFEPLLPIDHGEATPERIFQANIDLIRKAQIVVANLDPFRGPEPDSGTAFELGFALALGKKVCGYVTRLDSLAKRVELAEELCVPTC